MRGCGYKQQNGNDTCDTKQMKETDRSLASSSKPNGAALPVNPLMANNPKYSELVGISKARRRMKHSR